MSTAPNDVIRVVCGFSYTAGGRPMSNVLHVVDTGGGGIPDPDLLTGVGLFIEIVYGLLATVQPPTLKYTTYSVQNVTQKLIIGTLPWPTLVAGTGVGNLDASQVACLLRLPTATSQIQGRLYACGLAEGDISSSLFDASVLAAVAAIGANLLIGYTIAPSVITYAVFNQVLKTFKFPVSSAVGVATRALGRRKLP